MTSTNKIKDIVVKKNNVTYRYMYVKILELQCEPSVFIKNLCRNGIFVHKDISTLKSAMSKYFQVLTNSDPDCMSGIKILRFIEEKSNTNYKYHSLFS